MTLATTKAAAMALSASVLGIALVLVLLPGPFTNALLLPGPSGDLEQGGVDHQHDNNNNNNNNSNNYNASCPPLHRPQDLITHLLDEGGERGVPQHCYCSMETNVTTNPPILVQTSDNSVCRVRCNTCDTLYPRCRVHNTCCPEVQIPDSSSSVMSSEERKYLGMRSKCMQAGGEHAYHVVRSCPDEYEDAVTRKLCMNDLGVDNVTMATTLMVQEVGREITYYNTYCAECHGIRRVRDWRLSLGCHTNLYVSRASTKDAFVRLGSDPRSTCTIQQEPAEGFDAALCDARLYRSEDQVVSSCNVGQHTEMDMKLEQKCVQMLSSVTSRVASGNITYKNVFCLLCNVHFHESWSGVEDCHEEEYPENSQYNFLWALNSMQFLEEDRVDAYGHRGSHCLSSQWMDPTGECRDRVCTEGKVLRNDRCETDPSRAYLSLPYTLSLLLVADDYSPVSRDSMKDVTFDLTVNDVAETIKERLSPYVQALEIDMGVASGRHMIKLPTIPDTDDVMMTFNLPKFVWMNLYFLSDAFWSRDAMETTVYDTLFDHAQLTVHTTSSHSTSYRTHFVYGSSYDLGASCQNVPDLSCQTVTSISFTRKTAELDHLTRSTGENNNVNISRDDYGESSEILGMTKSLTCPYVELSRNEIQETIEPFPVPHVTKISLRFGEDYTLELSTPADIRQVSRAPNGTQGSHVCVGLLESRIPPGVHARRKRSALMDAVQYWMTVVCVSASLLCLLATVVTYCLFSGLRCVTGCNTLGLSTSLIMAQILLFVANSIQGPSTVCTTIGVITHYSWLVMFAWTFLCCLHMARIFTTHNNSPKATTMGSGRCDPRDRRETALTLTFSFLAPAVVVLVIVVTYNVLTKGSQIGYGHAKCAMDSPLAIHVPLVTVVVCNLAFFFVVACSIWKFSEQQEHKEVEDGEVEEAGDTERDKNEARDGNQRYFVIYIKLSSLTGVFWLLAVLAEVFDNDVMRCLAILINGCQGVFIFLSFTANRRVLAYYRRAFCKGDNSDADVTTTTEAVTTTTSGVPCLTSTTPTQDVKESCCCESETTNLSLAAEIKPQNENTQAGKNICNETYVSPSGGKTTPQIKETQNEKRPSRSITPRKKKTWAAKKCSETNLSLEAGETKPQNKETRGEEMISETNASLAGVIIPQTQDTLATMKKAMGPIFRLVTGRPKSQTKETQDEEKSCDRETNLSRAEESKPQNMETQDGEKSCGARETKPQNKETEKV